MPTNSEDMIEAVRRAVRLRDSWGVVHTPQRLTALVEAYGCHPGWIDESTTLKELFMNSPFNTTEPASKADETEPTHTWGGATYTDSKLAEHAFGLYKRLGEKLYLLALMRTEHAGRILANAVPSGVPLWPQYPGSPRMGNNGRVYFAKFDYYGYSWNRLDLDWMYCPEELVESVKSPDETVRRRAIHQARLQFLTCYGRTPRYIASHSHRVRSADRLNRERATGTEIGRRMAVLRECDQYDGEVRDFIEYLQESVNSSSNAREILARAKLSDDYSLSDHGFEYATACGHIHTNTRELHDGRTACEYCVDNGDYVMAENNGEYYAVEELYEHSDGNYYTHEEDEEESNEDPYRVMEYSTNVMDFLRVDSSFTSSSSGDFHMGVEFESVWTGPERAMYAKIAELYDDGYAVAKYDGSISNGRVDGRSVEWVTQPTSLARHIETFGEWDMTRMRAWDCRSCGMHVHVDSKAFTKASLAKIIAVYNSKENAQFLRSIAGRHPGTDDQARDYANFDSELSDDTPPLDPAAFASIWKGKVGNGQGRYTMVNLCNLGVREARRLGLRHGPGGEANTVEFRLFRASTRKARLLAQLEFVHAAIVWARQAGIRQCLQMEPHFRAWIATRGDYPNLRAWLRTHREHGLRRNARAGVSLSVDDEADTPSAAGTA